MGQQRVGAPNDEFLKSVYSLVKAEVLIGSGKEKFDVSEKIKLDWMNYYKLQS